MRLRKEWMRDEKDVAKMEGGKVTPGSGNKWFAKQDVVSETRMVQVKGTDAKAYRLQLKDLDDLERHAAAADKEPAMVIIFNTPNGRRRYVVTPYFGVENG